MKESSITISPPKLGGVRGGLNKQLLHGIYIISTQPKRANPLEEDPQKQCHSPRINPLA